MSDFIHKTALKLPLSRVKIYKRTVCQFEGLIMRMKMILPTKRRTQGLWVSGDRRPKLFGRRRWGRNIIRMIYSVQASEKGNIAKLSWKVAKYPDEDGREQKFVPISKLNWQRQSPHFLIQRSFQNKFPETGGYRRLRGWDGISIYIFYKHITLYNILYII